VLLGASVITSVIFMNYLIRRRLGASVILQKLGASVIFMNYLIRRRRLGKNSIIITLAATSSWPALMPVILCRCYGKSGQALGCMNGFM
jgi:hypothetical protein